MKKLVTITTLTAGIGASLLGTTSNAHAAENTQNIQNNAQYNTSNQQSYSTETTSASSTSGNLYTAGQCTWYVFDKVGGQIGSTWGNANNWASAAEASGYTVNHTPEKGSILQSSNGAYGHVAYVENVGSDGSVTVSEMNYNGGPYVVDTRTISSSEASSYNYIHLD
ncbi:CHAP domain-containing protein [Staphylococcus caprae]|uniref:CHAP domain-containing protein n=1 Tax=Staphylococcus TaxID=1279 RepID=UPI0008A9A425|nr:MULTISPECIES: CHAP domain-containing protein [Staphylococcus]MCI2955002.1 CHAP domain-containing protein [Staphylococcus caprae]OHS40666.1 CHAP domain-containing protein [Staphylococcus sp. HMSC62A08]